MTKHSILTCGFALLTCAAAALFAGTPARADPSDSNVKAPSRGSYKSGSGQTSGHVWQEEDTCALRAQRAYPDHDAASAAKRDAAMRRCVVQNGLTSKGITLR